MNVFVIDYAYTTPVEKADELVEAHRDWLDGGYAAGVFLASGPKRPRTGGVMLAVGNSRSEVEKVLRSDPFAKSGIAEYKVVEFGATKTSTELEKVRKQD